MHITEDDYIAGAGARLPRRRRLFLALLLGLMAAFGPLCTDTYLPSLPAMAADLSISTATTQLTITACLLGMALGQLFVGPLSDSTGRRKPLFVALVFFTLASACCAAAKTGNSFIALRFAQGLGGAGGIVLARAMACDLFRGAELTNFMSLLMVVNGVAPITGPMLGGWLAALSGWPAIFYFLTGFGVLLVVLSLLGLPETLPQGMRRSGGIRSSWTAMGELLRQKPFMCYVGVQGFTMGGFFGYVAASPFVLQGMYGLSPKTYSIIFGCNALSLMFFAFGTARNARRLGEARLLRIGNSLRAVACLGVLAVTVVAPASPVPLLIGLFFMIALQGMTLPTSFTIGISAQNVGAGTASGILGVSVFIFGALTSPLVGLAGGGTALPLGIVSAVTGVASALLGYVGDRELKKLRAASGPEAQAHP